METLAYILIDVLGNIIRLALTILAISAPVACTLKGYGFLKTNLIALPIMFGIVIVGAYLADAYPLIQLKFIGFDLHGMSDAERLNNVAPALKDTATELYNGLFGIGWPLKAIIAMVLVSPYPATAWVVLTLVKGSIKKACR